MKLTVLTNTSRSTFRTCRYKYFLKYICGVRARKTPKALRFGIVLHEGLHRLKIGEGIEEALGVVYAMYANSIQRASDVDGEKALEYERSQVSALVEGWSWRWSGDTLKVIASEHVFRTSIVKPGTKRAMPIYRNGGVIDWIVKIDRSHRIAIVDHKTTSESIGDGDYYWDSIALERQPAEYVAAARLEGHDIDCILWDVIRKPTIKPKHEPIVDDDGFKIVVDANGDRVYLDNGKPRQSASKAEGWELRTSLETPDEYGDRLFDDITYRPEFYFNRREIARTDDEIDTCLREMYQQADEIRRTTRNGHWYRNTDQCMGKYGACEFLPICHSKIRLEDLPEDFRITTHLHPELERSDARSTQACAAEAAGKTFTPGTAAAAGETDGAGSTAEQGQPADAEGPEDRELADTAHQGDPTCEW